MEVNKLKQWTKREDEILREEFFKVLHSKKYGGRWHAGHYIIKEALKNRGIDRTEKAVSRRLNRLGLRFYIVKKGEVILKCADCKKAFITFEKYINREYNKKIYCFNCALLHRHDWNKQNREQLLKYYNEYYKIHKIKKINAQRERRKEVKNDKLKRK